MCALSLSEVSGSPHTDAHQALDAVVAQVGEIILGKEHPIRLAVACLLASGHLLIEDVPGVGKTTLAQALAKSLGLSFHRIQFTSDLLPADILGVSVYDQNAASFQFHPGPIFCQLVLADEVNRATPKAQSALLEAMEEQQVTQEGETRPLPEPFFVIATQNPSHQIGTFPLPESQLDRFLMRLELGYPDAAAERALLKGRDRRALLHELDPVISPTELSALQQRVCDVRVSDALLDYLQSLIAYTRDGPEFESGLSPRAGIAVVKSTQAWALLHGRDYTIPEDVQAVLPVVIGHRLRVHAENGTSTENIAEILFRQVAVP